MKNKQDILKNLSPKDFHLIAGIHAHAITSDKAGEHIWRKLLGDILDQKNVIVDKRGQHD